MTHINPPTERAEHPLAGGLLVVLASLLFAAMGAAIRSLAGELPNEMVVFFRNLFGLLVLLPLLWRRGMRGLATRRLHMHVTRSLAGLAAMYCFFYALGRLPLAEAVLLNFTAPLFIPFFALLWLGERVPKAVRWAAPVGFVGILLILKPGLGLFSTAALSGLAAGLFAALAMVALREVTATEPTTRVVFYYGVICTLASALPLAWAWQLPTQTALLKLLATGVFATGGQLLLTRGYGLAPAARIGPFTYTAVIFAALFGWMLWDELPDLLSAGGALLVIGAGILAQMSNRPDRAQVSSRSAD